MTNNLIIVVEAFRCKKELEVSSRGQSRWIKFSTALTSLDTPSSIKFIIINSVLHTGLVT